MDRNRPYDGQPHTDQGERGKTLIEGLTMRDVADCILLGFLDASGGIPENPDRNSLYSQPGIDGVDPGAVIQNAVCHVEKMMGIFPNIPKLETAATPENG